MRPRRKDIEIVCSSVTVFLVALTVVSSERDLVTLAENVLVGSWDSDREEEMVGVSEMVRSFVGERFERDSDPSQDSEKVSVRLPISKDEELVSDSVRETDVDSVTVPVRL